MKLNSRGHCKYGEAAFFVPEIHYYTYWIARAYYFGWRTMTDAPLLRSELLNPILSRAVSIKHAFEMGVECGKEYKKILIDLQSNLN